jgi:hypothetical protein
MSKLTVDFVDSDGTVLGKAVISEPDERGVANATLHLDKYGTDILNHHLQSLPILTKPIVWWHEVPALA